MRLSEKKSPALVLSGGGVKAAAFHIGVCLALREKGFRFAGGDPAYVAKHFPDDEPLTFRTYVGSSAGSIISTFLASGYSIDAVIDAFTQGAGLTGAATKRRYPHEAQSYLRSISYRDIFAVNMKVGLPQKMFSSWFRKRPLITGGIEVLFKRGFKMSGIFTMTNLEKYLREHVVEDNQFSKLGVSLFIVATQLNHSRKVIFGDFEESTKDERIKYANFATISDACAASASLPPAFAPYGIKKPDGKEMYFFDGEIRDTLSTHVASDHGSDLVIASYSIKPYHFNPEIGSLNNYGVPIIINQALYQLVEQKITSHIEHKREVKKLINAVNGYLKQTDIAEKHREKLMEILISRTKYKPDVEYIYIHPSPHDYEMFFADHFSLNPKILSKIVRTGFKAAMNSLRQYNI